MKRIKLTQGKFAIVDDADYEWLSQWKWYAVKLSGIFYAVRGSWGYWGVSPKKKSVRQILMHREVMSAPKNQQIDHRNNDALDNRRENLRIATPSQNAQNRRPRKNTTSRHKGVSWYKKYEKWCAFITIDHKNKNLGYFDDEDDAGRAYDKKALEAFGEFANLNFKE
ncbi:hypothetical protein LCGC14_0358360 [marine sediment metagenome]|uniref:AP2/ERF domain-containing protein n=1 Tax=marine sediment metagenome TaxID=412755 RepID=A0A0F9VVT5_9ZZZZ